MSNTFAIILFVCLILLLSKIKDVFLQRIKCIKESKRRLNIRSTAIPKVFRGTLEHYWATGMDNIILLLVTENEKEDIPFEYYDQLKVYDSNGSVLWQGEIVKASRSLFEWRKTRWYVGPHQKEVSRLKWESWFYCKPSLQAELRRHPY